MPGRVEGGGEEDEAYKNDEGDLHSTLELFKKIILIIQIMFNYLYYMILKPDVGVARCFSETLPNGHVVGRCRVSERLAAVGFPIATNQLVIVVARNVNRVALFYGGELLVEFGAEDEVEI